MMSFIALGWSLPDGFCEEKKFSHRERKKERINSSYRQRDECSISRIHKDILTSLPNVNFVELTECR
jgi:hypothetical protein